MYNVSLQDSKWLVTTAASESARLKRLSYVKAAEQAQDVLSGLGYQT